MNTTQLRALVRGLVCTFTLLLSGTAQAGYYAVLHNQTNTNATTGSAIAIAMPATDNGRITVTRLRVTSSKATSLDFQFRSARETSAVGDTKSMSGWTCSLPGCQDVYALDGLKAGEVYDVSGLQLALPPGNRLFVYTDNSITTDYFSIECWWSER